MVAYAALLRGINLGSHNKIAMPALRQVVGGLGVDNVATYLQSGNVVFTSPLLDSAGLAGEIEGAITQAFGLDVPVVMRTNEELAAACDANPFKDVEDQSRVYFTFLQAAPAPERLQALASHRLALASPGGEEFAVVGSHIYLHCPVAFGNTKLTNAFFERQLKTVGTARNTRTTNALVEMTAALA